MAIILVMAVLLIGSLSFGIWAYAGRQDYKDNTDDKIASAVQIAVQAESSAKEREFVEREKSPLKTYKGPAIYGSINLQYPKSWSGFVTESANGSTNIDGYFYPGVVPGTQSDTDFALRVQVVSQSYAAVGKQFDDQVKSGKVKVSPYSLANVPGVVGIRVEGEVESGQRSTMVVVPLRDKAMKIWTESPQFVGDFDSIVMANFRFIP